MCQHTDFIAPPGLVGRGTPHLAVEVGEGRPAASALADRLFSDLLRDLEPLLVGGVVGVVVEVVSTFFVRWREGGVLLVELVVGPQQVRHAGRGVYGHVTRQGHIVPVVDF